MPHSKSPSCPKPLLGASNFSKGHTCLTSTLASPTPPLYQLLLPYTHSHDVHCRPSAPQGSRPQRFFPTSSSVPTLVPVSLTPGYPVLQSRHIRLLLLNMNTDHSSTTTRTKPTTSPTASTNTSRVSRHEIESMLHVVPCRYSRTLSTQRVRRIVVGCAIGPTRGGIESVLTHIFEEWCIDVQSDEIPAGFSGKRCTEAIGICTFLRSSERSGHR